MSGLEGLSSLRFSDYLKKYFLKYKFISVSKKCISGFLNLITLNFNKISF